MNLASDGGVNNPPPPYPLGIIFGEDVDKVVGEPDLQMRKETCASQGTLTVDGGIPNTDDQAEIVNLLGTSVKEDSGAYTATVQEALFPQLVGPGLLQELE